MKRDNLSIEGLRVILFLAIFLFHAWGTVFPMGWAGIDTFLVITSYFLTKKLLQLSPSEMHLTDAIRKRAIRLYPPYLVVVLAMTFIFIITKRQLPGDFFSYFLFAQNYQHYLTAGGTSMSSLGHLWYLTLDFYLVIIWLLVFKFTPQKYLKFIFCFLLICSVTYRSIIAGFTSHHLISYTMPWGMMDTFSIGGLLATLSHEGKCSKFPWYALLLGVIGFAVCIYMTATRYSTNMMDAMTYYRSANFYADNPFTIQIHFFLSLISCFIVWFCIVQRKPHNILSNNILAKIGGGGI